MLRAFISAVVGAFSRLRRAFGPATWMVVLCVILWTSVSRAHNNPVSGGAAGMSTLTDLRGAVTAGELLLIEAAAALEYAASATGAAPAVRVAFPTLAPEDLKVDRIFVNNWQRAAGKASKQSSAIMEEFSREMQSTHRRLVYILGSIDGAGKGLRNPDNNTVKDEGS